MSTISRTWFLDFIVSAFNDVIIGYNNNNCFRVIFALSILYLTVNCFYRLFHCRV